MKIALAGNPNCGKTTLFNSLTGSSQYVGNWPGVTVEKKEGKLKGHKDVTVVDLPGIYSLSPYSLEEVIARNYLIEEKPDVIINLVDATNLERNLYLTTQLLEMGIPCVIALNMMDLVRERKDEIQTAKLSSLLKCPICEISALKNTGIQEMIEQALSISKQKKIQPVNCYQGSLKKTIERAETLLADQKELARWYAVKVLENDEESLKHIELSQNVLDQIAGMREELEKEFDDDMSSIITNARYEYIGSIQNEVLVKHNKTRMTTSDKIDRIVTNRWLALPIFVIVMYLVYYISMVGIGAMGTDWVNDELFAVIIPEFVDSIIVPMNLSGWLYSLIQDGIVAGVGAVLGFVPQIMVLFFLLAILEDSGYMARVAFIMDRIFRKFGLSGKSFIPMLISTGCGVPGIMASRTIEDEKDRKMTIMLTTFIPCSAKLPIFALFAGALFNDAPWVSTSMYFIGMAAVIISGILLKKTKYFGGDPAPFVMELPAYHWPSIKGLFIHMWDRAKSFIHKAGTVILLSSILVWFLGSFNWSLQMVDTSESMLATIGGIIAPIFAPLGWGDWRSAVAAFTGLIAKENIVSTFGILYGFAEVAENGAEIWSQISSAFTPVTAYSFMVFNLLCAPCFAAIGAIRREMGTAKWTLITIAFQCGLAYVVALLINVIGNLVF